jgi:dTMP kinase
MPGVFITFEGGDGSGKSTQATLLADWLRETGRQVVESREPGGTDLGLLLREIILHRNGYVSPRAEALLYAADRAQNIAVAVRPALERGEIVVQDRYVDSSLAYQGAGRTLDPEEVRQLSTWATDGLAPDLTVLLDLEPSVGRARRASGNAEFDRLEAESLEFHGRVRDAYRSLAEAEPTRFLVVDATQSVEIISTAIRERVVGLLT